LGRAGNEKKDCLRKKEEGKNNQREAQTTEKIPNRFYKKG